MKLAFDAKGGSSATGQRACGDKVPPRIVRARGHWLNGPTAQPCGAREQFLKYLCEAAFEFNGAKAFNVHRTGHVHNIVNIAYIVNIGKTRILRTRIAREVPRSDVLHLFGSLVTKLVVRQILEFDSSAVVRERAGVSTDHSTVASIQIPTQSPLS